MERYAGRLVVWSSGLPLAARRVPLKMAYWILEEHVSLLLHISVRARSQWQTPLAHRKRIFTSGNLWVGRAISNLQKRGEEFLGYPTKARGLDLFDQTVGFDSFNLKNNSLLAFIPRRAPLSEFAGIARGA